MCRVAQRARLGVENWPQSQLNPAKPCNAHLSLSLSRGLASMRLLNSISERQLRKLHAYAKKGQKTKPSEGVLQLYSSNIVYCILNQISSKSYNRLSFCV